MVQKVSCWKVLTRKKQLSQESADGESKLNRVLGLYDLTALGVGSTLGAGVYVLAGQIAKDQAGPSVMLSFAIAALASLLAGICYAEFGARVPKAGSAYVYSYVCIGEFAAFVIGWNLILEYMIGTASVCRGISLYLDTLINDTLKTTFAEVAPMNVSFLGSYFDFFSFGLVIVFGVALAFGVETSAIANNFCTCLNLFILIFVIVAGSLKANFSNWTIDINVVNKTDIPPDTNFGEGGFFPFGFTGTLKGAATCFFGFVGFDCIATTGEEVQNPRKNIPRSILVSLLIIFLCYFGVSTVITLMVPYYLQDANAPLPSAFRLVGWNFAMWIVSIGGLIGLLASLLGALFPLPRVMYSMAQDGLMFRVFGRIHPRYRVPVVGSIVAAILTAFIAGLFDLAQLVDLLSIGTLLAYSVVAISITILRYMDNTHTFGKTMSNGNIESTNGETNNAHKMVNGNGNRNNQYSTNTNNLSETSLLTSKSERITFKRVIQQLFNLKREYSPNDLSTKIVGTLITVFCILSAAIGLIFMQAYDALINNQSWVLISLIVLCVFTVVVLLCICLQPRELSAKVFTVPLVPLVPAISIFINIYLMLQLDVMTWIRFGVWMAIGLPMFVACWCMYDIKNPANRHPNRIEFEKLLKLSSQQYPPKCEEFIKYFEKDINISTSTIVMQQNEHSVKSLDDIMDLNEVENELKQVKHPNGEICFIENNDNPKSLTSINKIDENKVADDSFLQSEEKSVIALLDNVLETVDDNLNQSFPSKVYNRKASIDSEMVPSVFRSTTVATVHSSSKSNSFNNFTKIFISNRAYSTETYKEKQKIAQELVEEILNSKEILLALQEFKKKSFKTHTRNSVPDFSLYKLENKAPVTSLLGVQSTEPRLSMTIFENPLRSENFRNKLSMLIMKPADLKTLQEIPKSHRLDLQHSRSESDVTTLTSTATEDIKFDTEYNTQSQSMSNQSNLQIPRPPKFDQALYNTINSINKQKGRHSLEKLLNKDSPPRNKRKLCLPDVSQSHNDELTFKQKLETMLKRGPPHKTQIKPENQKPTFDGPLQHLNIKNNTFAQGENSFNSCSALIRESCKPLKPVIESTNKL